MAPALLATLALAGPAEARVEQKTVSESASSIKSYWTADRMGSMHVVMNWSSRAYSRTMPCCHRMYSSVCSA